MTAMNILVLGATGFVVGQLDDDRWLRRKPLIRASTSRPAPR